ncbi:MAG: FmdE family protein [Syntrophobacteraceae bacterium]|nr:FmdE family protein [Syntrophobacteraceae bacterium]
MSAHYPEDLQKAIRFHGHMCPGLAIGYRAARTAQAHLAIGPAEDEELVAVVESDGCGIDAIQALLSCTMGKGNLIYRDHGKQVYTVLDRKRGLGIRVATKPGPFQRTPEQEQIFRKVMSGEASQEEVKIFEKSREQKIKEILEAEETALFTIEKISCEPPEKARIFNSITCEFCGEPVMEPRARVRDGKMCCIPCAGRNYDRGW